MKMTSRERVKKVINFKEADRVPIDMGGTEQSGIHIDEYIEIGRYLGIDVEPPKVFEQYQMLARFDEIMRRRLHTDVIELENPSVTWGLINKDWKPWKTAAGHNVLMPGNFNPVVDEKDSLYINDSKGNPVAYKTKDSLYFERACKTSMSLDIVKMDPEEWKKSILLYSDKELRELENNAKLLYDYTEYSIHGGFNRGKLWTTGTFAGHSFSDWLCVLALEEEYAYSILQATAEQAVENLKLYMQAVGKYIDTILISSTDYGTQKAEIFSPKMFKELYAPNMKLINDFVHNHSNVKTMYHSCGSIWNILEYLIESGTDIINPVQTSANNMEPEKLMQRFGGKVVFWGGGVDTQGVLQSGSVDEVREQVKQRLKLFAPGGGFVFNPVHNVQYGVPPENLLAAIDTVIEFGNYSS